MPPAGNEHSLKGQNIKAQLSELVHCGTGYIKPTAERVKRKCYSRYLFIFACLYR